MTRTYWYRYDRGNKAVFMSQGIMEDAEYGWGGREMNF